MKLKLKDSTSKEDKYNDYITEHVANVQKAFNWIFNNLHDVIEPCKNIANIINKHDASKYSDEEFIPYADYFYGERNEEVDRAFNYAWLHHIHANPHHWQHWILVQDDEPTLILDMEYDYIIEMICDWWAFSWKSGKLTEIFDWYEAHKDGIQLSDKTRELVENILHKIYRKLDQVSANSTV